MSFNIQQHIELTQVETRQAQGDFEAVRACQQEAELDFCLVVSYREEDKGRVTSRESQIATGHFRRKSAGGEPQQDLGYRVGHRYGWRPQARKQGICEGTLTTFGRLILDILFVLSIQSNQTR